MHRRDTSSLLGAVDHVIVDERSRLQELHHNRRIAQVLLIRPAQVPGKEDQGRPAMLTMRDLDLT